MSLEEQRQRLRDAEAAEALVPVLRAALVEDEPSPRVRIEKEGVGVDAVFGRPALEAMTAVLDAVVAGQRPTVVPIEMSLTLWEAADRRNDEARAALLAALMASDGPAA